MIHEPSEAFERVVSRLKGVKETSKGVRACCPAHDDRTPSLDVDRGDDGRVLLKCRSAGCLPQAIVDALDLRMGDLFPEPTNGAGRSETPGGKKKPPKRHATLDRAVGAAHWAATNGKKDGTVTTYEYTDADGVVVGAVVRVNFADGRKKEIRRVCRDGDAWLCRDMPVPKPLYRRHCLQLGTHKLTILLVEGEKCVNALEELGFVATTSSGGSKAPLEHTDWSPVAQQDVVVLPDNDGPGRDYAAGAAERARRAGAASVRILTLEGLGEGGDIFDWIQTRKQAGMDIEQIAAELREAINLAEDAPATTDEAAPQDASTEQLSVPLGNRDPESGRLVLSPTQTLPTAIAYLKEFCTHNGLQTLHHFGETLWSWRGNRYELLEDAAVLHDLHPWLHRALRYIHDKKTREPILVDFDSNPGTAKAALATIKAVAFLPASTQVPGWLDGAVAGHDPRELVPCKSATLHLPSGELIKPTPLLFNFSSLDFDYAPAAPDPLRWYVFLRDLFGDDHQSIELLQEWCGYCLTADTRQQKILLLVGPRRSGKGTIARVLRRLVGEGNVVGPTVGSLAGNFGLQPLLGRSLAIVSDARFTGENVMTVVERLLCISGEDSITVDRKFKEAVTMTLPVRFVFLTNEMPRFNDSSTALAGRFLVLRLSHSFYGKEDPGLTDALLAELPGILLWAIQGWYRLNERGHFLEPESSREAIQDIEDLSSPVSAFVRERCTVGAGLRVPCAQLYQAWISWCTSDGRTSLQTAQSFGRDLSAAVPSVTRRRGTDVPFYDGIRLRPEGQP